MSAPSRFHRRPSPVAVPRQQRSQLMSSEQVTRQSSSISTEGYHRNESASIPFMWESQPGTPKVKLPENPLPPLSPPPSYYYTNNKRTKSKVKKDSSKGNLLQAIFPKRNTRKGSTPSKSTSPSLSNSSSSSSSFSSPSPPRPTSHSVPSSPMIYSRKEEEDEDLYDVPVSGLCFGNARSQGCYSSMIKKVLLGDFL